VKFLTPYLIFLTLFCPGALAQHTNNWPQPPEAADKSSKSQPDSPSMPGRSLDQVQLRREARELLELSQSLQPDIEQITHGILPKDTIEKLKRIEKLSKHLRGEVTP
jgi:hypothetical protein